MIERLLLENGRLRNGMNRQNRNVGISILRNVPERAQKPSVTSFVPTRYMNEYMYYITFLNIAAQQYMYQGSCLRTNFFFKGDL